jgi:hypothetical protein
MEFNNEPLAARSGGYSCLTGTSSTTPNPECLLKSSPLNANPELDEGEPLAADEQ